MGSAQTDEDTRGLSQRLAEAALHPTAAHIACKTLFDAGSSTSLVFSFVGFVLIGAYPNPAGHLRFLMTTNVDGLHIRTGFVRSENMSELHGNR
jgi:hypothetical protein